MKHEDLCVPLCRFLFTLGGDFSNLVCCLLFWVSFISMVVTTCSIQSEPKDCELTQKASPLDSSRFKVGPTLADRLEQLLLENDDLVRSMHEAVLKNRPRAQGFPPGGGPLEFVFPPGWSIWIVCG